MTFRAPALLVAASLAGSCDAWPLAAHLPDDGDPIPATTDPRALVQATWRELEASGDDDQPPGADIGTIASGTGVVVSGTLVGSGWWDRAVPEGLLGEACDSRGVRVPTPTGDYVGDVDVIAVTFDAGGVLCADADLQTDGLGFDLLLAQLDACGVPVAFVEDGDGWLGADGIAPHGEWRSFLAAGVPHAVVLAAFTPTDAERVVPYRLSLSRVEEGPCPLPPPPPAGVTP